MTTTEKNLWVSTAEVLRALWALADKSAAHAEAIIEKFGIETRGNFRFTVAGKYPKQVELVKIMGMIRNAELEIK